MLYLIQLAQTKYLTELSQTVGVKKNLHNEKLK